MTSYRSTPHREHRVLAFALAITATLAWSGCAGQTDADSEEGLSSALLGAPEDTKHAFDVGVCQGPINSDPAKGPVGTCRSGTAKCSGTLIAPNLVMTARHCVAGQSPGPQIATNPCDSDFTSDVVVVGGTRITTSPSVYVGAPKWYEVTDILVPSSTRVCEADVALLVLGSNVPSSEARYVGVDLWRDLAEWRPRKAAIVGRGSIDETWELDGNGDWTGGYSGDRGDLLRRVLENIPVTCASNGPTPCTAVDHEVPTTHVFTAPFEQLLLGPGAASGDSGAGVIDQAGFRFLSGRFAMVMGVATWIFIGPDGKNAGTGAQRLDHLRSFIEEGASLASQKGGYRPVWWTRLSPDDLSSPN